MVPCVRPYLGALPRLHSSSGTFVKRATRSVVGFRPLVHHTSANSVAPSDQTRATRPAYRCMAPFRSTQSTTLTLNAIMSSEASHAGPGYGRQSAR